MGEGSLGVPKHPPLYSEPFPDIPVLVTLRMRQNTIFISPNFFLFLWVLRSEAHIGRGKPIRCLFCVGRCPFLHKNNPDCNAGTLIPWSMGSCISAQQLFVF